jgi:Raf kinase inhibitor-like YbhB/YbcL family protein
MGGRMNLTLSSSSFENGGVIPRKHTCEGEDVSPPLSWSGAASNAKTFALVVEDPDAPDPRAPKMTWVHWVLYNIPANTKGLAEGTTSETLPARTLEGLNDWKGAGYRGPCPPIGRHRYFFRLYALDTVLPDLGYPTKAKLEKAMTGHVLAEAHFVGTYQKGR